MTCPTCVGRDVLGTTAHYAWCSVVGGPGHHPGSLQAMAAQVREHRAEQHRLAAEEAERQKSNNGWVKYRGDERSYEHLVEDATDARQRFEADLESVIARFERPRSAPVAQSTRPGKEVPQEIRELVTPLLDQGFRYAKTNARGKGKPRLIAPSGQTYTLPNTPSDWRALANLKAGLRQLGAAV